MCCIPKDASGSAGVKDEGDKGSDQDFKGQQQTGDEQAVITPAGGDPTPRTPDQVSVNGDLGYGGQVQPETYGDWGYSIAGNGEPPQGGTQTDLADDIPEPGDPVQDSTYSENECLDLGINCEE